MYLFTIIVFIAVTACLGLPAEQAYHNEEEFERNGDPYFLSHWSHCANGWHLYKGNCYKWSGIKRQRNWFSAQLDCRRQGGHLVSIANAEESEILRGLTSCENEFWLGLVNTNYTNGKFLKKEGWSWWDDRNEHSNFTKLTISNTAGVDCSYAKAGGKWQNSYCSNAKRTWVCKREAHGEFDEAFVEPTDRQQRTSCGKGWVAYNGHCYWFANGTANYFHAQLHCGKKNSSVVTVHSKDEQAFLQAINGCEIGFWLGLAKAIPCFSEKRDECWEWIDLFTGSGYRNWYTNNPIPHSSECSTSRGYWRNNISCSELQRFVCKRRV